MKWSAIAVLSWGRMTKLWYLSVIGCRPPKEGGMTLSWGSSYRWLRAGDCYHQREVLGSASHNFLHILVPIFGYFKEKYWCQICFITHFSAYHIVSRKVNSVWSETPHLWFFRGISPFMPIFGANLRLELGAKRKLRKGVNGFEAGRWKYIFTNTKGKKWH